MQKLAIILCTVLCLVNAYNINAQTTEVDKFTGEKRIESKNCIVTMGISQYMKIQFRSNGNNVFIEVSGTKYAGVVGTTDPFIILFTDSSKIEVYPASIQSVDISYGSNTSYNHIYNSSINDVKQISNKTIASVRRYYSSYYGDLDVKEGKAEKISEAAKWFISEYKKN